MLIKITNCECVFFRDVITCHDFFAVCCVNWHVTWVSPITNSIIDGMYSKQIFYRLCWPRRLIGDFRDVSTDTRPIARSGGIFRCCNISNVCTCSACSCSIVVLFFGFGIIPFFPFLSPFLSLRWLEEFLVWYCVDRYLVIALIVSGYAILFPWE